MKDALFAPLFIIATLAFILWVVAMVKPKSKIVTKILPKAKNRRGYSKVLLPVMFITLLIAGVVAPPIDPEVANLNLNKDQEVITETFTLEGEIKGDYEALTINGEALEVSGTKFKKELPLKPGNNSVEVRAIKIEEDEVKEFFKETYNIYFDYEGMLYAEELKKDQQAEEELKRKLAQVPQYEMVRKDNTDEGFTVIVYMEGDLEDYLISNVIKDIKNSNSDIHSISLLLFDKASKNKVEAVLESTDIAGLLPYVRANYEKHDTREQLFWFPKGTEGAKLALEV